MITREVVFNLRKEFMQNIRKEVLQRPQINHMSIIEKIKKDLKACLEPKGIDISNLHICFKPEDSNVTIYLRGE